ncbi:MAG: hypothetical protein Q8S73_26640 [Deltaproteobacteria bacterium]|nr:hypothetical protein [Myxococcales bacterium]MDP3217714.1 hypothetical protein [Deltaproteobacteria bacterium]
MNILLQLPTVDPLGDATALAVARRLATMVGPAIRAADGSVGAAQYLALGYTIGVSRTYVTRSLAEIFGHLAIDELAHWERSLGMLSGEGAPTADRQAAVHARWIALRAGPSVLAIRRALERLTPDVLVIEILASEVSATDPLGVYRLAVLLPEAQEADAQLRARISATLAPQAQAQVSWAIGRGEGPDLDPFLCGRTDSLVGIDLLAS